MLAYAASRPVVVDRRPHPNAMLAIIAVHVALLAVAMSAKMEFVRHWPEPPIVIDQIPIPKPPPPNPMPHPARPQPGPTASHNPTPLPPLPGPIFPTGPTKFDPGPIDPFPQPIPEPRPLPTPHGVSGGALLLTPPSELKPPYPASKLDNGEEATLRLKLTIDANGRVIAVEPVGRTDPAFLDAARRHLIAHWRYKPAMDDGHAVASSEVITLRFELNG
ncbi:MAG TPA: energy transducer TonB [Sphingomicrobium sp.]|jgi:protein TonB|nr:energy transducer TonB [Sphingomicrobium sp.]